MKRIAAAPSPTRKSRPASTPRLKPSARLRQQGQIAGMFAQEEFTGPTRRTPLLQNLSRQIPRPYQGRPRARRKRLVNPDSSVLLLVGQRDEILLGHPNHPATLHDFLGAKSPNSRCAIADPGAARPAQTHRETANTGPVIISAS